MPGGANRADEFWMAAGHPAEHEKRSLHLMAIEQPQQLVRVIDDAAGEVVPAGTVNVPLKGRNLIVVFDVDGKDVEHGPNDRRVLDVRDFARDLGVDPRALGPQPRGGFLIAKQPPYVFHVAIEPRQSAGTLPRAADQP